MKALITTFLIFNPVKYSGNYIPCVYELCITLGVNNRNLLKQHKRANPCNGNVLCFLFGTDRILKYFSARVGLKKE